MLRYSLVLVAGVWVAGTASAATWADGLFDELTKDYGSVPRGPALTHHFRVTNRTRQAVNISSVRVSCGCLTATAVKTLLQPGEQTTIYTTMDTTRFTGPKSVTVFVQFDSPKAEEVRLWVRAVGRNDFNLAPSGLAFGQIKRGTEAETKTTLTFYGHTGAKVTALKPESNYVVPKIVEVKRNDYEVTYEVKATLRKDTPVGKWYTDVWLTTNVSGLPKVRVPVTVEVESPLTVSPNNLGLGVVRANEDNVRRVIVRGVKPFRITTIKGSDTVVQVSDPSKEAREVHVLTIKLKPQKAGAVDRTLRVVTDLKEDNEIDFKVNAVVAE